MGSVGGGPDFANRTACGLKVTRATAMAPTANQVTCTTCRSHLAGMVKGSIFGIVLFVAVRKSTGDVYAVEVHESHGADPKSLALALLSGIGADFDLYQVPSGNPFSAGPVVKLEK